MFYGLLFLVMVWCSALTAAPITSDEFSTIVSFLQNIDLATANNETYSQFMSYVHRVAEDGSPEQQALVETILEGNEQASVDTALSSIEQLLSSDIITPEVWQQKVMQPLRDIESMSNAEEKNKLNTFIATHKDRFIFHCKKLIDSLRYDPRVKEALQFIIVSTLIGIVPSLGLKSLSILSGNLPLTNAATQLIDLSILSALDGIIRYSLKDSPEYAVAPFAAALSTAVQDFIGFAGPRPSALTVLGASFTTSELAALQAGALVYAKQTLIKPTNVAAIVKTLDWKEVVVGSGQEIVPSSESTTLTDYLQTTLSIVLKNKTVRAITASTLSYALEGAFLAAALNVIGVGVYGESTTQALTAGMLRGALEGLYMHTAKNTARLGIVQRVNLGLGIASVQKYLTTGVASSSLQAMVPLVTQQVIAGAVNGIVQKAGGWKQFVTTLIK